MKNQAGFFVFASSLPSEIMPTNMVECKPAFYTRCLFIVQTSNQKQTTKTKQGSNAIITQAYQSICSS